MKKKILVVLLILLVSLQYSVSAASSYKSYVYDNNGEYHLAPDAFYFDENIDLKNMKDDKGKAIGMVNPHDIFASKDGLVYVSGDDIDDKGMVLVLNSDLTFNKIIRGFKHTITLENGKTKEINDTFGSVTNVFVDNNDGSIYICDKNGATADNSDFKVRKNIVKDISGRVIKMTKDYKTQMIISGVKNEILPKDFIFQPFKIVVDAYGRIFILSNGFTMGIMEFDAEGGFVQCIGAPAVTYNPIELFWRAISTDDQKKLMEQFVPTEYSGIDIDDEGFIFVTNNAFEKDTYSDIQGLSKLNAKGNDVLRTLENNKPYGDTDASWKTENKGPSKLVDVMTVKDDIYAVLDQLRGKIFFYNIDGICLFEFGTVKDSSDGEHYNFVEGNLNVPVGIEWLNDQCLVVDSDLHCINTYSMTEYAEKIFKATALHNEDKYDEEIEIWNEVLKLNNNSVVAKQNIAKVYYRNKDYKTAMKYFKEIKDQENYSKAYKYQRQQYINDYFTWALLILVLLIVVIKLFKKWRKAHEKERKPKKLWEEIKFSKVIMFRPLNGPWLLTRENKGSPLAATIILLSVSLMSLLQARFTGFVFDAKSEDVNILIEFARICIPVLLFVVCNWAVTSLMNGEGSIKAIYMGTCYSLMPIMFLYPVAILLSNIMVQEEGDFYTVFVTLALFWVLLLVFLGNMRIHDYNLGMAVLEIAITVVVMLLVVFLAILFAALIQQMIEFVQSIIEEISLR